MKKKNVIHRISFFSRKCFAYQAARFDLVRGRSARKPPANRFQRLLTYKAVIATLIETERGAGL